MEKNRGNSKFQTCVSSRPFNLTFRSSTELPGLVFQRRGEEKGEKEGWSMKEKEKGGSGKCLLVGVLCRLAKVSFKCFFVNSRGE